MTKTGFGPGKSAIAKKLGGRQFDESKHNRKSGKFANKGGGSLSPEHANRTRQALTETRGHLAKELGYMPKHQKQDRIKFYKEHIAKLEKMLKT